MKHEKYYSIMTEVFGVEYVNLIKKDHASQVANLRKWKLDCIDEINKAKHTMGYETCVDKEFFKLYDMEPEELSEVQHFYTEEASKYFNKINDPHGQRQAERR